MSDMSIQAPPKAFISYSWEGEDHSQWVLGLASQLRHDGIDTTLDRWHAVLGDQLPDFMERAIRENDFILIICTPTYKTKSEARAGGVGYEGDVMTAEVFTRHNHRKFIPILCKGTRAEAMPSWLAGKLSLDLSGSPYSQTQYDELLATLHRLRSGPPPVGKVPERLLRGTNAEIGPGRSEQIGTQSPAIPVPVSDIGGTSKTLANSSPLSESTKAERLPTAKDVIGETTAEIQGRNRQETTSNRHPYTSSTKPIKNNTPAPIAPRNDGYAIMPPAFSHAARLIRAFRHWFSLKWQSFLFRRSATLTLSFALCIPALGYLIYFVMHMPFTGLYSQSNSAQTRRDFTDWDDHRPFVKFRFIDTSNGSYLKDRTVTFYFPGDIMRLRSGQTGEVYAKYLNKSSINVTIAIDGYKDYRKPIQFFPAEKLYIVHMQPITTPSLQNTPPQDTAFLLKKPTASNPKDISPSNATNKKITTPRLSTPHTAASVIPTPAMRHNVVSNNKASLTSKPITHSEIPKTRSDVGSDAGPL